MATNPPVVNVVDDRPAVTMTADVTSLVAGNGNTTILDAHIQAINELVSKLKPVTREAEEFQLAIGQHILSSRAYELMAVADGTKSTEQTRRETNARKLKHRQNCAVRSGTDKKELAAIDTQIAEIRAAHVRQIDRYKRELAQLSDAEALRFERNGLRVALGKIEQLLTEARGLTGHFVHNRSDIVARINRARNLANSALHLGKSAACNPANLSVKHAA